MHNIGLGPEGTLRGTVTSGLSFGGKALWLGMKTAIPEEFANDPLFLEVLKEGLAIQDRFSAEPIYAKTGKGALKSAGVEELQKLRLKLNIKKSAGFQKGDP